MLLKLMWNVILVLWDDAATLTFMRAQGSEGMMRLLNRVKILNPKMHLGEAETKQGTTYVKHVNGGCLGCGVALAVARLALAKVVEFGWSGETSHGGGNGWRLW
ncbi:hypothetical protein E3N88_21769 [Mikania micrantha]|uniref:Uncharacterized protein n=1 Tax=Mikania micrantha TaxID=192012 RepID=A0A5N6NB33_9ASTR|nr:hypothetical protein E3N88_21769 [Mikania micrantha]